MNDTNDADDTTARDPLDALVEQFLLRHRAGESITVATFAAAHPQQADSLRELLPTLLALEHVKRDRASSGSGRSRVALPALERLGDFRIVREIGRGGMGVVFEAVQESLGRKVALKVLPQASLLTGNQLERFRREAQIAAQLHHSNIVPVFGSGESEGYHWYAMQFIVGDSLDRWLKVQAASPPSGSGAWRSRARFVARVGGQAAGALHHAHSQGTLHRDVKPGNLLLESSDHLWVTDFGLAKALEAEGLTHSGDLLGTLQYMAPEQFTGQYDVRSEVYALGVTLYELLVLRPAFLGTTRSELMERIRTQRPESLRRLCPEVPEDLVVVVEKCMARDPADRFRDAQALEHDLSAFLEDRPIAARRQSSLALVLRWCRRNRAMAALAVSTLLAVVGAGITGWVAYGVTDDALVAAEASAIVAAQKSQLVESNLALTLAAFDGVFDALVGRDPTVALDEDPDTGEQTVIVRTAVEPRDVLLLQQMVTFYDQFAAKNADSQALRYETARACHRVGAIRARLGKSADLEAAAKAYERALSHLAGVTDRDVRQQTAAVRVDFGQLERRRGHQAAAVQQFQDALQMLASEPSMDSQAARLELAEVHFLLASEPLGVRPGGPGRPGGGPPSDRSLERRRREQLQRSLDLLAGLLVEQPDHAESRALKARGLLQLARFEERRPAGEGATDDQLSAWQKEAIDILRELVGKYPEADHYRFEWCEALLSGQRRERGRPAGLGRVPRPNNKPVTAEDVLILREATAAAERLKERQPLFLEYQALRGRAGSMLGQALRDYAVVFVDVDRERVRELRAEAEQQLRESLLVEVGLLAADGLAEPRFVRQVVATRCALGMLLLASDQRGRAIEQAEAILVLLEGRQAAWQQSGSVAALQERLQSLADLRRAGLPEFIDRLGDDGLKQRLERLRPLRDERRR